MAVTNPSTSLMKLSDKKPLGIPHLTFSEAKAKVNDEYSGLKLMSLVHHIPLPPRFLHNVNGGIREQLNSNINVYNDSANGVLVAYSNVKAMQRTGIINYDEPSVHFQVRADAVYFQPQIGDLIRGAVNKVGKDHIGCLVHGCFNVSLTKPRGDCPVKVDDELLFEVTQASPFAGLLAIKGKLHQIESNAAKRKRTESLNDSGVRASKRPRNDDYLRNTSIVDDQEPVADSQSVMNDLRKSGLVEVKHEIPSVSELLESTLNESKNESCGAGGSSKKKKKQRKSEANETVELSIDISQNELLEEGSVKSKRKNKSKRKSEGAELGKVVSQSPESAYSGMNDRCDSGLVEVKHEIPSVSELLESTLNESKNDSCGAGGSSKKRKKRRKSEANETVELSIDISQNELLEEGYVKSKRKKKSKRKSEGAELSKVVSQSPESADSGMNDRCDSGLVEVKHEIPSVSELLESTLNESKNDSCGAGGSSKKRKKRRKSEANETVELSIDISQNELLEEGSVKSKRKKKSKRTSEGAELGEVGSQSPESADSGIVSLTNIMDSAGVQKDLQPYHVNKSTLSAKKRKNKRKTT